MKTGLFLSAASGIMLLGSVAAFAQSDVPSGSVILKPGQTQLQSDVPTFTPSTDTGIVSMKPGETVYTAAPADLGSVQAGATAVPAQPAS